MPLPNTETVECDLLIIGGGMSGCGAAFESKYWSGDMNVVMVEGGGFIEIQGTAEAAPFDDETLDGMLVLAKTGITALFREQRLALGLTS